MVSASASVQFSSVTQSCLTLCDTMNHSTPGLPVHHQLSFPEFHFPDLQNKHNGGGLFHPWEALILNLFSASPFDSEFLSFLPLMQKLGLLCTSAGSNLGSRVLGEVETWHFGVPGKGEHSRVMPSKAVCLNPGGFGEEFYNNGSRVGC